MIGSLEGQAQVHTDSNIHDRVASSLPPVDWRDSGPSRHTVQFYEDDSSLLEGLGRFIGSALGAGDAAIVIATKVHREALVQRLKERGMDLGLALAQGRFILLDAAETLSKFVVDDWPDESRFTELVGDLVTGAMRSTQGKKQRVTAFGEMVALLWQQGNPEASIRLEQLWNELARTRSFHLHCAYPISLFSQESHDQLIQKICAEHSHVIPAESYTSLLNEEERLRSIAFLQQKAQALVTETQERKKAQSDLRLREAELIDFLENAVIGMHWVAADGTILWANKADLDMLGYARDEYIGHHISEFHADQPVAEDILQRLGRHEQLRGYESRMLCRDGSSRYVRIHSNVLVHNGRFVHTRCFTVDITEQKQAEEACARLAAIVQSSDDAIVSKDLNGIVTSWNASAERIFGYKAEEIVGQSITVIIPPELQDQEKMILAKIRRNERIEHFETVRMTKSGVRIDVSLTVSPVKDEHGAVIGVAKIVRDISENKKLEQTLRTTEKLASVGRLAASVAHEINNPLEALTNLLFLAKRDISDRTKVAQCLEQANQELDRVTHIAAQTLGFYRETSSVSTVDLAKMLEGVLALYARKISSRGIKVTMEYEGKTEVKALAGEIRQVMANLMANSLDAMPNGGSLRLRISSSHSRNNGNQSGVRVIIADTGSGIQPENMKQIFEPFFTTKKDTGTGLGLWITRAIIQKHGGSIRVRSKPGTSQGGTVFSIFLPETGCDLDKAATPKTGPAESQDNKLWLASKTEK